MPRFRAFLTPPSTPLTADGIRELCAEVIRPPHFFVAPSLTLTWEYKPTETLPWEVFRGRLLAPQHTRVQRTFESWHVYQHTAAGKAEQPLLALYRDRENELHVVRGLESHVWEAYSDPDSPTVIQSRERRQWVRELVGTISVSEFSSLEELCDELICLLFSAVVGTSKLPLASVEAPLPAFSFGQLLYCHRPDVSPTAERVSRWEELVAQMLQPTLAWREQVKLLETFLLSVPHQEFAEASAILVRRWEALGWGAAQVLALLRGLFNEVSLTPYTHLTERVLSLLRVLEQLGTLSSEQIIDLLSFLLRQQVRHLTAYDLITFHHRGANYPDALVLDQMLKEYLTRIEQEPQHLKVGHNVSTSCWSSLDHRTRPQEDGPGSTNTTFPPFDAATERRRRRALRQAWVVRRSYEGHRVPDQPTSPGENQRVLPESHPRIPEEQLLQPRRRQRRLYADDPLSAHAGPQVMRVLAQSVEDLSEPEEYRELGLALFLDRPLGCGKEPTEPDGTLVLACEAFSPTLAAMRKQALMREVKMEHPPAEFGESFREVGLPLDEVGGLSRPGVLSLLDARQASADFRFQRTTRSSVQALLHQFDFTPLTAGQDLGYLMEASKVLIVPSASSPKMLLVYDEEYRVRLELEVDTGAGYTRRAGQEYPTQGLLVRMVREPGPQGMQEQNLRSSPLRLLPR